VHPTRHVGPKKRSQTNANLLYGSQLKTVHNVYELACIFGLDYIGFINRNSSSEPLFEGLLAQIHIDLSRPGFQPESNRGPADNPILFSPVLLFTELW